MSEHAIVKPAPPADHAMIGPRGFEFAHAGQLMAFCRTVAGTQLAPKGMSAGDLMVSIQMGLELGLSPTQAIQSIAVINGRPALWGDGLLALCQSSESFDWSRWEEFVEGEGDNRVAVCRCARVGGRLCERRFSVADAKQARLWGKQGPWSSNPSRMLQLRARAFALRDTFADLLRGLQQAETLDYEPTRHEQPKPRSKVAASIGMAEPEPVVEAEIIEAEVVEEPPADPPTAPWWQPILMAAHIWADACGPRTYSDAEVESALRRMAAAWGDRQLGTMSDDDQAAMTARCCAASFDWAKWLDQEADA